MKSARGRPSWGEAPRSSGEAPCAATSGRSSTSSRRRPTTRFRAASLQFVRKISGYTHPSQANAAAFDRAVDDVAKAARTLLASLVTNAEPRDREREAEKARARNRVRFGAAV